MQRVEFRPLVALDGEQEMEVALYRDGACDEAQATLTLIRVSWSPPITQRPPIGRFAETQTFQAL